jgi:hypothetical protein
LVAWSFELAVLGRAASDWPRALRRYLAASLVLHLVWEAAQLPLYTIWSTGTVKQQAFAVLHCTIGDAMIAGLSLLVALCFIGWATWPSAGTRPVWLMTVLLGIGYAIYSEWFNVGVRGSWAYSGLMPTVPIIGTGLSPLLQWLVVPTIVQWIAVGHTPWVEPDHSNQLEARVRSKSETR